MKTPGAGGWAAALALAFFTLAGPSGWARAQDVAGVDLSGVARTADGDALAGARVFIHTAGPKVGVGIVCPSCYADCRKQTKTDAEGKFSIPSLAPDLVFRVLVAAPGFQPTFVAGVDPAKGPIEAKLKAVSKGEASNQILRGRVTNLQGRPISGAVVNIRGVTRGESTRFGGNADVDPLAVTDDEGVFAIHGEKPFNAIGVDVEARGFAKGIFRALASGGEVHELKLGEGATLKGKLTLHGEPAAGLEVGISGSERSSEIYVGNQTIRTDAKGQFLFSNVTPDTRYEVYGIMKSLGSQGCVTTRTVKVAGRNTTLDVGELKIEPAFVLEGEVKLTDGKTVPEKTRVMLGRDDAWDYRDVEVDAQGRFRFEGAPPETVSMSARIKGYRLSARNASLDGMNGSLLGRIVGHKTNLVIELERGERRSERTSDQVALRDEPLRGAEKGDPVASGFDVTGTARDAVTGEPLAKFAVVEGRWDEFSQQADWFRARRTEHTQGKFSVNFAKPKAGRATGSAVMIEAEGYLPQKSGRIDSETNLTFALKKGSGPSAVLLRPDGAPAANTKVYLTDMKNGVYLRENMEVLDRSYPGTITTTTDGKGRFQFAPNPDAFSLIAISDVGFLEVKMEEFVSDSKLQLQEWGRVEGRLMIGSRPGGGESIRLNVLHTPYADHPRHFPALAFHATATTDEKGNFVFEKTPPVGLTIYHSPQARDQKMGTVAQAQTKKISAKPGETTKVALGGEGRPVIGKIVVTGYEGKIDWRSDVQSLEGKPEAPAELPDMRAMNKEFSAKFQSAKTDEEKTKLRADFEEVQKKGQEKTREFYQTEAGKAYAARQSRDALIFKQDGTFRIEDIRGGKYLLRLDFKEPGEERSRFRAPSIAQLQKDLEIPITEGQSDEPYDLGVIEIAAKVALKMGKNAPEFETKTVDGKSLRLSDYKGKYLLLDFWAVWCGPCVAETPYLKETYAAFKNDPRFAMVGLSLDPEKDAPIQYQKKNDLGWTQGFLGEWSGTDIPRLYGVEGIPAIFLIGPDGTILKKDLRGDGIKAAVREALAAAN